MPSLGDAVVLLVLLIAPATAVVVGSLVLGWMERHQDLPVRPSDTARIVAGEDPDAVVTQRKPVTAVLWAVPFAILSAALVLAPVAVAVWSVVADAPAVGYLATVGFGIGALMVGQLAHDTADAGGEPWSGPWSRTPGVLLSAAVGFIVALVGFLGAQLAGFLGFEESATAGIVAALALAVVLGALAVIAWRRRT